MDLQQLLAALAKLPEGSALADALKAIIAGIEADNTSKTKLSSKAQKEADKKAKALEDKLNKVCDTLGLDIDDEDLEEALGALVANKGKDKDKDSVLQKRLDKLERQRAQEKKDSEALLASEKGKRIDGTKRQELMKALTANNANRPDDLLSLLMASVEVGDDESLTFTGGKTVEEGVKTWLTARPEFIKNVQNAGGGSGGNPLDTKGADGKTVSFGTYLAKQATGSTKVVADGQAHFFGTNG